MTTSLSLLVVGGCILDVAVSPHLAPRDATSNDAGVRLAPGGTAHNVARNLVRLGSRATLVSAVGEDEAGRSLRERLAASGVTARLAVAGRSAVYVAVLSPAGDLDRGYCDPGSMEELTAARALEQAGDLSRFDAAYLDANLSEGCVTELAGAFRSADLPYALEPVSVDKACRLRAALPGCALVKPNRAEAQALTGVDCSRRESWAEAAARLRAAGAAAVALSLGPDGLYLACDGFSDHVPAAVAGTVRDTTGAGDALLAAGFLGLLSGASPATVARAMSRAAALACAAPEPVSTELGPEVLS